MIWPVFALLTIAALSDHAYALAAVLVLITAFKVMTT